MATFKIPHNEKGDQLTYQYNWSKEYQTDNYDFEGTLKYKDFERGRSALNIVWEDMDTHKLYRSGMKLLHEMLTSTQSSIITGKFSFKKQGTSILLIKINGKA